MYVERNSVALSPKTFFSGNTTTHSVGFVDLQVTVKCIIIIIIIITLSVVQQCFYGKFVTLNNANYSTSFPKKLYSNQFALFPRVTYKDCIEKKECYFAHSLLQKTIWRNRW
jgi:hypothetical protein